jgi:hypothetical protein
MSLADIRAGLRTALLSDAAVAALVVARIYPVKLPQGIIATSLVYNEISGIGDHHMQGPSGLARVRMQIGAWAQTADAAHALFLAVKEAIDGYQGLMGTVVVQGCFIDSWRDIDDTVANLRGKVADYMIHYAER